MEEGTKQFIVLWIIMMSLPMAMIAAQEGVVNTANARGNPDNYETFTWKDIFLYYGIYLFATVALALMVEMSIKFEKENKMKKNNKKTKRT